VKAQQVKNAVIVPVGAKGGFFPKLMPANPTREQFMETGIAAYKIFINTLLDITDTLDKNGAVVPPPDVMRPDGDDPYLVVAATRAPQPSPTSPMALRWSAASGWATPSRQAAVSVTTTRRWVSPPAVPGRRSNAISAKWAPTSRPADFTVVGVGDMSGDVFGNGMLLSRHIRLVAAFDHRHIFLDPHADAATGFAERERLFNLPRSSWDDYNKALIGQGGGIYARSLKEIPLSPEVKTLIGSDADSLPPPALINAC
jgi:glutamate dehydrogenase